MSVEELNLIYTFLERGHGCIVIDELRTLGTGHFEEHTVMSLDKSGVVEKRECQRERVDEEKKDLLIIKL